MNYGHAVPFHIKYYRGSLSWSRLQSGSKNGHDVHSNGNDRLLTPQIYKENNSVSSYLNQTAVSLRCHQEVRFHCHIFFRHPLLVGSRAFGNPRKFPNGAPRELNVIRCRLSIKSANKLYQTSLFGLPREPPPNGIEISFISLVGVSHLSGLTLLFVSAPL